MTNSSITGTNSSPKIFASNKAGISGIIKYVLDSSLILVHLNSQCRKKEEQHAANAESLDTAFSDLKVNVTSWIVETFL
jgi:hypothetical protein